MDSQAQQRGWFTSSYSSGSCQCVEVKFDPIRRVVAIRDSKYLRSSENDPAAQPVIAVTFERWGTFLAELLGDEPVGQNGLLGIEPVADGATVLRLLDDETALVFTPDEWEAFLSGVRCGEFDPQPALV